MTLREFYLQRAAEEFPVFMNVLKALPKDQLSYKPHERCPSAEQLAWTITNELSAGIDVVTKNQAEWKIVPAPPMEEMLEKFDSWSNELKELVSKMDDASWERPAQFYFEGKMMWEQPVGVFLWFILFDAIHHRGQLSAYLRPMGGKVPSIYGPSADTQAASA